VSDQTKEAIFSYDSSSIDAELFSALTQTFSAKLPAFPGDDI
jgi:hypothetical protein